MEKDIKRSFILGEEWVYFKIYTGIKTADTILVDKLSVLFEKFLDDSLIDDWFFIRYYDPDFHIRLRLRLKNKENLLEVITMLNFELNQLMELNLLWKVQFDTYNRELERYGFSLIEESEFIFCQDSKMIIKALKVLEDHNNPNLKWLYGLYIIDSFMTHFELSIIEKKNLMENLKDVFGLEMGLDKTLKKQLSSKYHKHKIEIESFLNQSLDYESLYDLVKDKNNSINSSIRTIKESHLSFSNINDLISSHIHMKMNRLFSSNNRKTEFVCYQLLFNYYESKIARIKYNKV